MRNNKMNSLLIYIIVAAAVLGIGYFVLKFPSGLIIKLFLPTVSQSDLKANPHKDYSGLNAGNDIPRVKGMSQYEDGTFTGLDFVTVETSKVIPMNAYRLKSPADINSTDMYLGKGRAFSGTPLKEYTVRPSRRGYLYGRYFILGLSDGSYVAAYADQSYGMSSFLGGKVTFPVGRLRMATSKEKEWLNAAAKKYPMDTSNVLYMISDTNASDLRFWDLAIRAAAVIILIAAAFIALLLIKRKR